MAATFRLRPFGLSRVSILGPSTPAVTNRCCATTQRLYATSDRLPKIADTSVWTAMIPAFMRKRRPREAGKRKEWNPATFYIVIFTLIGSQAIRMLTLKNDYVAYRRTTDAKIKLLKEVIERVKNGENVDVEKILGTGDEAKEKEWEEVMREIEQEDVLWREKQKSAKEAAQSAPEEKPPTQKSEGKESVVPSTASADEETMAKTQSTRKLNFF